MKALQQAEPPRPAPGAWSSWPWLTIAVAAAAGLASTAPGIAEALEYQRPRIAAGEVWRLATSQAVHWSPRMAAVDLGMVLLLGALLEARSRRLLAATLTAGTIVCGLGIHYLHPSLVRYRGASGVASALLAAVAVLLLRTEESRLSRTAAALGLALVLFKIMGEIMTGRALFAGPLPPGIDVTPLVHLAGALTGVAVALAVPPPPHRAVKSG